MSVLVSDQDRGGDVLTRIAPSKTVKLSEYSKSRIDGVWRIADHGRCAAVATASGFSPTDPSAHRDAGLLAFPCAEFSSFS